MSLFSTVNSSFASTVYTGSSYTANISNSIILSSSTSNRIAFSYILNNFASSSNGIPATVVTSGQVLNNLNKMYIGSTIGGQTQLNGRIKKFAYYPQAFSSSQLQALTLK
jgi:hypothetical protein